MNRENLIREMNNNEALQRSLCMTNTNNVWNYMLIGLNQIILQLAPTKIIQLKRSNQPYMNDMIRGQIAEANQLDMSICRLGLGLKFEKFTFDWMFLSKIKAWKCMRYSEVGLS